MSQTVTEGAVRLRSKPGTAASRVAANTKPAIRAALQSCLEQEPGGWKTVIERGANELLKVFHSAFRGNWEAVCADIFTANELAEKDWQNHRQYLWPEVFQINLASCGSPQEALEAAVEALSGWVRELVGRGLLGFVDYFDKETETAGYSFVLRLIEVKIAKGWIVREERAYPSLFRPAAPDGRKKV